MCIWKTLEISKDNICVIHIHPYSILIWKKKEEYCKAKWKIRAKKGQPSERLHNCKRRQQFLGVCLKVSFSECLFKFALLFVTQFIYTHSPVHIVYVSVYYDFVFVFVISFNSKCACVFFSRSSSLFTNRSHASVWLKS